MHVATRISMEENPIELFSRLLIQHFGVCTELVSSVGSCVKIVRVCKT